ncbi:hypothetical protein HYH02_013490 [Chlamydomonas schloesseri]|uniref:Protein ENHANCED DISEASE RESISTANCE 2 C-terminal domain-containing protein n=1 Tax=Chlamydomonas schloesseri TaxID=2026947 RepID=A0A835SZG0_9CHLO|nr:hypothetical protein HYH02_013490 [Chlamydomonas schloesseri]|eukprot:KAG2431059.1 hypothetical protein HYH02_013490 [Chlamydomonas schloesseri]
MAGDDAESSFHFTAMPQPKWTRADSLGSDMSALVLEGKVYKGTRTGLVVERLVSLFQDRCTTYHDPVSKTDARTWLLDRNCEVKPATAGELAPKRRGVRPKGKWAITAAVAGVDTYIDLYEFTIDWPASWAASGYTTLDLGFSDREEAVRWHNAVTGVLAALAPKKGGGGSGKAGGLGSRKASATPSELGTTSVPPGSGGGLAVEASSASTPAGGGAGGGLAASASMPAASAAARSSSMLVSPSGAAGTGGGGGVSASAPASARIASDVAKGLPAGASEVEAGDDDVDAWAEPDDSDEEGDSEDDDEGGGGDEAGGVRWVPYRQTNGVAIYQHSGGDDPQSGGEYMVSCAIRGRPQRVADALLRLRNNTTILGPAEAAEVLQTSEKDKAAGREVVRLVLTATGTAGFFCAPREIILESMRKEEEDGVIVVMFKSVDLPNEASSQSGGKNLFGKGLYKRPVRGSVAGGYTIAGLKGKGTHSEESLVTCILKIDLGGVCTDKSWARPLVALAGWTDAFLERILMSVTLLRDEVEQRRFTVQPFKMVSSAKARFNEDGAFVGSTQAAARAQAAGLLTSYISVSGPAGAGPPAAAAAAASAGSLSGAAPGALRPAARMQSLRTGSASAAAAAAAAAAVARAASKRIQSIAEVDEAGGGEGAVPGAEGPGGEASGKAPGAVFTVLDIAWIQSLATMPRKHWSEIHIPGTDAPFVVRGPTYLKDHKKVPAGPPAFRLGAMEMVKLPPPGTAVGGAAEGKPGVVQHVARFIKSIREGGAPFSVIIHLVLPGSPLLGLVVVFCCDKHPSILGSPPQNPMDEPHDWQPFDFMLHKFVYGTDEERNKVLKLIPHIASGSWMIKQSVGTTPVILGKALKVSYHCTPTYIEVDIDISANSVANYVTGMVRGATSSLVVDLGFVLEGQAPWELPECLLGCFRLANLDCNKAAVDLDWSRELPLKGCPEEPPKK